MGASLEQFSALVSDIYDAALDASLWSESLKDLVTMFDGRCGALLINTNDDLTYDQRESISLAEAIQWAGNLPGDVTLYLYDEGAGTS